MKKLLPLLLLVGCASVPVPPKSDYIVNVLSCSGLASKVQGSYIEICDPDPWLLANAFLGESYKAENVTGSIVDTYLVTVYWTTMAGSCAPESGLDGLYVPGSYIGAAWWNDGTTDYICSPPPYNQKAVRYLEHEACHLINHHGTECRIK